MRGRFRKTCGRSWACRSLAVTDARPWTSDRKSTRLNSSNANIYPLSLHDALPICIAYLTIEHAGEIPEDVRPLMGVSLFGCDRCTSVDLRSEEHTSELQ